jgi:hypothetical protein
MWMASRMIKTQTITEMPLMMSLKILKEMVLLTTLIRTTTTTTYPIMKILMLTTTVFQIVNSSPLPEQ